jgi:hypothetical protein
VIAGIAGAQGDGAADALGGLTVISLLLCDDTQQVQGVGMVGLAAEEIAVQPGRLAQAPALVLLQAEGKVIVHGAALRNVDKGGGWRKKERPPPSTLHADQVIVSVSTAEAVDRKSASPL